MLNGNGQAWWDGFSGAEILDPNNKYYRPILFLTDNATNIEVSGLHLKDSPCWTTFMVRTKNVIFDNVYIDAVSTNASVSSCLFPLLLQYHITVYNGIARNTYETHFERTKTVVGESGLEGRQEPRKLSEIFRRTWKSAAI